MYKVEDILIPVRFLILMLQIIITATFPIMETYKEHIRANFPNYYSETVPDELKSQYRNKTIEFFILLGFFYIFELFELIMIFVGITLFRNKLSFILIFFHSICILFLNWFKHDSKKSNEIYIPLILGGIVPFLLEGFFLCSMCNYHRRLGKIQ
jgi:hypothetical protein